MRNRGVYRRLGRAAALAALLACALPAAAGALTISQSSSTQVVQQTSIACFDTDDTFLETSWYRVFDLTTPGMVPVTVSSVTFGIEDTDDGQGTGKPVTVALYALSKSFILSNLEPLAERTVPVFNDESPGLKTVQISGTIPDPATTQLVIEVYAGSGAADGSKFIIGSNSFPETAESYIRAPDCGVIEPSAPENLIPDPMVPMHPIILAEGTYPGEPQPGGAPPPPPPVRDPGKRCKKGKRKSKAKGKAAAAAKKKGKKCKRKKRRRGK